MIMFRRRRDRSTTTSVSEFAKLDSRFIGRILPAIRNEQQQSELQPLYYANKSPVATDRLPRCRKGFFYERRHPLHRRALLQS
jgi:hypothetical protein